MEICVDVELPGKKEEGRGGYPRVTGSFTPTIIDTCSTTLSLSLFHSRHDDQISGRDHCPLTNSFPFLPAPVTITLLRCAALSARSTVPSPPARRRGKGEVRVKKGYTRGKILWFVDCVGFN
eukprot:TRINITY_DN39430_c0_g1_i1.p1 TRINITY_DN39430_c0_g1~~TRINITY_DN39430_c0_g1_i1.p1  ORF type:complete len:122 (+),score=0.28 TRINITY_DN39430_c0_g1_i1:322-687(+)